MMHQTASHSFPVTLVVLLFLLTGCAGLTPEPPEPITGGTLHGQCERPLLPDVFDAESSAWHWLEFNQTTPVLDWAALPAHPADHDLAFAWALYFSQPGQNPVLLQLGIGQLQRLKPNLPASVQPLIELHQNAARELLLEYRQRDQQRQALQSQITSLQQALEQKQAQIDALTAIESQLMTRENRPAQEDTP